VGVEVKVTLHGILRDLLPRQARGRTTLELPERATVADALEKLMIKRTVSVVVDGERVDKSHVLRDGDDLQLFRPIGGG